ncbi:MAG: HAD hydrolase-like protein [Flammeovirgaceae bacterium]|nr:HAD hydrolase-like protein [Flammeovirgaceae bacterium]
MDIELVIFDLAGTTVKDNQDVHKVLQKVLAQVGVTISLEEANAVMGIPKPVAIRILLEQRERYPITDKLVQEIHDTFVSEMIHFYQEDDTVGEKEGVSETFRKLKQQNIKVGIDTGFDRQITNALLNRLGWVANGLIDCSVTSDEVEYGRPHPDLIYKAMKLTGVNDIRRVAKVGDTVSDLQEGSSAGCGLVIAITSGAFSVEQLQREKHTHLINQIPEVLELIKSKIKD